MYEFKLAIIGLGYVGLPLAIEFAKKYSVIGFDINRNRVEELRSGHDATLEVNDEELQAVLTKHEDAWAGLFVTDQPYALKHANFYIVTVPTPVDRYNKPDLR